MSVDQQGNDLGSVNVPITGMAGFAPAVAANVIAKEAMGVRPLVLPPAAKKLGLFKQDGGPADSRESGDPIEFFQQGYSLAGEGTRSVTITLAEQNPAVIALIEGKEPDENGVIEVDSELPSNRFILYSLTRYRSKRERFRQGVANITAVEPDQQERGSVEGTAVTFTWRSDPLYNDSPFWQWDGTPGETVVSPTGATAGAPGMFTPVGATLPADLTALQGLGALGQGSAWGTGEYVVLGDASRAYWDGDSWEAGEAV